MFLFCFQCMCTKEQVYFKQSPTLSVLYQVGPVRNFQVRLYKMKLYQKKSFYFYRNFHDLPQVAPGLGTQLRFQGK